MCCTAQPLIVIMWDKPQTYDDATQNTTLDVVNGPVERMTGAWCTMKHTRHENMLNAEKKR